MRYYNGQGKLDSLTVEVLYNSKSRRFHAPTSDGDTLCGTGANARRHVSSTPPGAKPCGHCYSPKVVEKYEPRDADLIAAVRNE